MYVKINGLPPGSVVMKNNVSLVLDVKHLTFFFFLIGATLLFFSRL